MILYNLFNKCSLYKSAQCYSLRHKILNVKCKKCQALNYLLCILYLTNKRIKEKILKKKCLVGFRRIHLESCHFNKEI